MKSLEVLRLLVEQKKQFEDITSHPCCWSTRGMFVCSTSTWNKTVQGAWQQEVEVLPVSSLLLKPRLQHCLHGEHTVFHQLQVDLRSQQQRVWRWTHRVSLSILAQWLLVEQKKQFEDITSHHITCQMVLHFYSAFPVYWLLKVLKNTCPIHTHIHTLMAEAEMQGANCSSGIWGSVSCSKTLRRAGIRTGDLPIRRPVLPTDLQLPFNQESGCFIKNKPSCPLFL